MATFQILLADMLTLKKMVQKQLEHLADWIFAFTQRGGQRRWTAFLILTFLLWVIIGLIAHPLGRSQSPLLSQLFAALFAKDVLRHILVLGVPGWLALRLAAIYLDDIFELNDVGIAERFLRQAAYSSQYPVIRIKEGEVDPAQKNSPVIRIGGPGRVDVHLENAALFEKPGGLPHVIGPTLKRSVILDGFERLRRVTDLRDQVMEASVDGRTQDGIPVTAKDVRVVFSVYRGSGPAAPGSELHQPYPFDEKAILALVYRQGTDPWVESMRNMIRSELRIFISRHTLNEFLAYADGSTRPEQFVGRDEITGLFYNFASDFAKRARENGIQLDWIGIGTWVTPAEIIPERHLEAWRLSSENRIRASEPDLRRIRNESRVAELLYLIDQIPATFYDPAQQELTPDLIMHKLVVMYREKLRQARRLYEEQNQPVPPELDAVIHHLTSLTAIRVSANP